MDGLARNVLAIARTVSVGTVRLSYRLGVRYARSVT